MNICCLSKEKIVCIKTEQTNVIFDAKLGIPLLHKCIFSSTHLRDLLSTFNRKLGESSHWLSTLWFSREIFDGAKVHTLRNALCVVLQMRKSLEVCPLFKLFSIDNNGLVLWKLDFCLSVQFFDVFVQGVLLQPADLPTGARNFRPRANLFLKPPANWSHTYMVDWHRLFEFRLYSASKPVSMQMSPRHFPFLSVFYGWCVRCPCEFLLKAEVPLKKGHRGVFLNIAVALGVQRSGCFVLGKFYSVFCELIK